jgi:hypothetical protein
MHVSCVVLSVRSFFLFLSLFLFSTQVLLFPPFSLFKFLDHMGEICAHLGSYLSHVELDTLAELDTFLSTDIVVYPPAEEIHLC